MKQAIISIKPDYADSIFAGTKTIEVRRHPMHIEAGTVLWIYVTLPRGTLQGFSIVDYVRVSTPAQIWKRYGSLTAITRRQYFQYIEGADKASAIGLSNVVEIDAPISLKQLQRYDGAFHPPQRFRHLDTNHRVHGLLAIKLRQYRKKLDGLTPPSPNLEEASQ